MLYLIYGKRNTGKSEHYEKILAQKGAKMYFATLWSSEDTQDIIERHRNRRDDSWIVRESMGDPFEDCCTIAQIIKASEVPLSCMIDGLMNWSIHCSQKTHRYGEEAKHLVQTLISLINRHGHVAWYLLDNIRDDYRQTPILLETWDIMYNGLTGNIKQIELIEWGQKYEAFMD